MIHPIQQFQLLKPQTQHDCDYLMQILSLFCMTIREKLNSRQTHIAHQEVNFTLTIHNNSVGVLCSMALSYRFWRNVTIYTTIYNIIYKGYHHMGRSQHALPQGFQHLNLRLWEHERARQLMGRQLLAAFSTSSGFGPGPALGNAACRKPQKFERGGEHFSQAKRLFMPWWRWGTEPSSSQL